MTQGPYSVVNGRLMVDGATARTEVTPSDARNMLNTNHARIAELEAALRRYREVSHYILTHIEFDNLPNHLQRDAEQCDDQARAALAKGAA